MLPLTLAVSGEEETKELHAHGVYSSSHLLALKLTAEMQYWMWRQAPAPEVSGQHQRSHAARPAADDSLSGFQHLITPGSGFG